MEQELLTRHEQPNIPRVLAGFVLLSLTFLCCVVDLCIVFLLLAIVLSVNRLAVSDCHLGIFKYFLKSQI